MTLLAGKMYRPTDVAFDIANDTVYAVEQFNHRISKWVYLPSAPDPENFTFNIDAGRITAITVNTGGTGYSVDDPVIISPPTNPLVAGVTATAVVASITGDAILTVRVTNQGSGYETGTPPSADAPTSGTSATFNAIVPTTIWGPNGNGTTGVGAPVTSPTDNALYRPSGIVFDGTRLVVTDTFHDRIRTVDLTSGAFLGSAGSSGFGITNFYRPAGIAVDDAQTFLVIADELNHRAVRYNVGATPSSPQLLPAPTPLSFVRPHGVIFDSNPNFFQVTDSQRGVISRYNIDATSFTVQHGTPGTTGFDLFFPSSGKGVISAGTDTVFADTRNNIIKGVDTDSIVITTNTTPGTGDGQLYYPESVASFVDSTVQYVLAANTLNHRVEAFESAALQLNFKANFGTP